MITMDQTNDREQNCLDDHDLDQEQFGTDGEIDLQDAIRRIQVIVGSSASAVLSNPEFNMNRLRDLLSCLNRTQMGPIDARQYPKTILAFHRLIALSGAKVFEGIIPAYRIKQHDSEERTKISKHVLKLRQFERTLSSIYKINYLDFVKRMLDSCQKNPNSNFYTEVVRTTREDRELLAETALICFGKLLVAHPHFNYVDQLISYLVKYCGQTKHERCNQIAFEFLCQALKEDKLGEVSLEITKQICDLTKKRMLSISSNLIKVLTYLKLIDVKTADKDEREQRKLEKQKLAKMNKQQSRREKKKTKKLKKLKNELQEAEAHSTTDQKLKYHRVILKKLFVIYFRLMKYHAQLDVELSETRKFVLLLPPVLEGVAKFAHLIDVALCNDMFPLLRSLLSNQNVPTNCKLHCLSTVFIMYKTLETELGKVDPETFYTHFYHILSNLNVYHLDSEEFSSLISCLHLMLIKRSKTVNNKRLFAFVRRLLILAINLNSPEMTKQLIGTIQIILVQRPITTSLFDTANCSDFGSGNYDIYSEDPDFCHADCSVAWELHLLRQHINHDIRVASNNYLSL